MEENSRKTCDFPKGWCETDLISIASKITDGSHNPPKKQESGFPMLSARNIQNNEIIFEDIRYIDDGSFLKEYARANVEEGDVLLTIVGTIGRSAVIKKGTKKFTLQRSVALVKPILIDSRFLSYSFQEPHFQRTLLKNAKGTAQKGVYLKTLSSLKIFLPPLPEQHRIVAKIEELFSELDQGIENLKTAQQQLKIYRQAVLKWAFEGKLTSEWREQQRKAGTLESAETLLEHIKQKRENRYQQQLEQWKEQVKAWEASGKEGKKTSKPQEMKSFPFATSENVYKIPSSWCYIYSGLLFTFVTSGSRGWAQYYSDNGSIFVRVTNLDFNSLNIDLSREKIQYVLLPKDVEGIRTKIHKNDFLFSITGYLGMFAIASDNLQDAYVNQHIALSRPLEGLNYKYFGYYFISDSGGLKQLNEKQKGATKAGLSLDDIQTVKIPLASIGEQEKIVEEIESRLSICDQLEATITENLEKAEALRQSILKRAFEGKLVPQDPSDEPAEKLLERIRQEKAKLKKQTQQLELEIQ
jgi:type I restriction enzyme, S subunit